MLNKRSSFNISPLLGLILLGLILFFIYIIFKGLFALASTLMPILVVATLIIDYKVYLAFGKMLIHLFKSNILLGLAAAGLTFLAFPLVVLFLFAKALIVRFALKGVKDNPMFQDQKHNDDYLEFEEIEDEIEDATVLELPSDSKQTEKNPFDDYFK